MSKGKVCSIYDPDTVYAKRLMNVINSDNKYSYNAQIFTDKNELDRYLQTNPSGVLMINEETCDYTATDKYDGTLVVLCEDEPSDERIKQSYGDNAVGIFKYQAANKIIQHAFTRLEDNEEAAYNKSKIIGVYGVDATLKSKLSMVIASVYASKGKTLYISLEEFFALQEIMPVTGAGTLSDMLYMYKQNYKRFNDTMKNIICSAGAVDYIPPVSCADDITYFNADELSTFITDVGNEYNYEYIVVDIGNGISMPWSLMEHCKKLYIANSDDYIGSRKLQQFFRYVCECYDRNIDKAITRINFSMDDTLLSSQFWDSIISSSKYSRIKEIIDNE